MASSIRSFHQIEEPTYDFNQSWLIDFDEIHDKELIYPLNGSASTKVYKAKYKGELVAVKVFELNGRDDIYMFRREIVTLHESQHEYVVKFIGASLVPNPFIVMEFIPTTLHSFLEESRKNKQVLELNLAMYIASCISKAMEHVHGKKIVHRDLKPQNILLTCDDPPKVKIADFGLARKLDLWGSMTPFRGTYRYMAPEIHDTVSKEVSADQKVDVFSFSMILWELLSSSKTFPEYKSVEAHIKMGTEGERPSLNEIPVAFKSLLRSCWSDKPNKRPDFTKIIDMLSRVAVPEAGL